MKLTDNFDARRLRPREPRRWRSRFGLFLALLLIIFGVALALVGGASLAALEQLPADLRFDHETAIVSLLLGLALFWAGLLLRRRIRRRLYGPTGISLSPRLRRKR